MMQKKNRPITLEIDTQGNRVSLQMLLSTLAIQHTPGIPIIGKVRYTINSNGKIAVTGKATS